MLENIIARSGFAMALTVLRTVGSNGDDSWVDDNQEQQ
jgi:hypothetical protein